MKLIKKGQKLYSILFLRCPRCHEGSMFPTTTLQFRQPFNMHNQCPVCKQTYEPEPGFYYGAMFISYGISAFLSLGIFAVFFFGCNWTLNQAFFADMVIMALLFVYIFRVSRAVWLNFFVHYQEVTDVRRET